MSSDKLNAPAIVIFTDLDGTLLDSMTYSFEPARPALRKLKDLGIPLIICSSKTRLEIERYRQEFGSLYPFVAENGGGI
ncbi:MAG: mannosyl-3-phosphoglycerate phosphatase, partial [Deltaproteobacteria bacterium]|nr:mannosyl-3-phosphoglycerate phosphatase [Deltaproteobacteria bacterium]